MNLIELKRNCEILKKKIKNLKRTKFNYFFIINEIILINLKLENILFDRKNKKGDPIINCLQYLKSFERNIDELSELKNHDNKIFLKKKKFNKEISHRKLFENLWLNYSFKEYKIDRIDRYTRRIKINKLENIIKDKSVLDIGCGHGNFLMACLNFKPKNCIGIDYGLKSINFAKKMRDKFKFSKKKLKFKVSSVYRTGLKKESFDFVIQNGVFHHLKDEKKAYLEAYRVLKKNGYFWIYTDGGGGLRDIVYDTCQQILRDIDKDFVINQIRLSGLKNGKEYHLGDNMNAEYHHTSYKKIVSFLKKIGFKNFKQMRGGFATDFDKPFINDLYFKQKFGSGDLRILCQKV